MTSLFSAAPNVRRWIGCASLRCSLPRLASATDVARRCLRPSTCWAATHRSRSSRRSMRRRTRTLRPPSHHRVRVSPGALPRRRSVRRRRLADHDRHGQLLGCDGHGADLRSPLGRGDDSTRRWVTTPLQTCPEVHLDTLHHLPGDLPLVLVLVVDFSSFRRRLNRPASARRPRIPSTASAPTVRRLPGPTAAPGSSTSAEPRRRWRSSSALAINVPVDKLLPGTDGVSNSTMVTDVSGSANPNATLGILSDDYAQAPDEQGLGPRPSRPTTKTAATSRAPRRPPLSTRSTCATVTIPIWGYTHFYYTAGADGKPT